MFATGPYAHETQLVSPPVFSTFTTEPSTAPLTPPPELAHLTTPSSPDVPYAQYLSSTRDLKNNGTYSPYPESPAGSCLSDREYPQPFPTYTRTGSARMVGHGDSNFFCPATFAQFYLDNPHSVGRLSVSRESDVYPSSGGNAGNGHHQNNNNWQNNKSSKQDVEEIEAYRASFGFSADEITTTPQYVEISDVMDESFTIMPYTSHKPLAEESFGPPLAIESQKAQKTQPSSSQRNLKPAADHVVLGGLHSEMPCSCNGFEGQVFLYSSCHVFSTENARTTFFCFFVTVYDNLLPKGKTLAGLQISACEESYMLAVIKGGNFWLTRLLSYVEPGLIRL